MGAAAAHEHPGLTASRLLTPLEITLRKHMRTIGTYQGKRTVERRVFGSVNTAVEGPCSCQAKKALGRDRSACPRHARMQIEQKTRQRKALRPVKPLSGRNGWIRVHDGANHAYEVARYLRHLGYVDGMAGRQVQTVRLSDLPLVERVAYLPLMRQMVRARLGADRAPETESSIAVM